MKRKQTDYPSAPDNHEPKKGKTSIPLMPPRLLEKRTYRPPTTTARPRRVAREDSPERPTVLSRIEVVEKSERDSKVPSAPIENSAINKYLFDHIASLRGKELTQQALTSWFNSEEAKDQDFTDFWSKYLSCFTSGQIPQNPEDNLRLLMISLTCNNLRRITNCDSFTTILISMGKANVQWHRELHSPLAKNAILESLGRFAEKAPIRALCGVLASLGWMGLDWQKDLANVNGRAWIRTIEKVSFKCNITQATSILDSLVYLNFPPLRNNSRIKFTCLSNENFEREMKQFHASKQNEIFSQLFMAQKVLQYPLESVVKKLLITYQPFSPKPTALITTIKDELEKLRMEFKPNYYEPKAMFYIPFAFILPNGEKYALVPLTSRDIVADDNHGSVKLHQPLRKREEILSSDWKFLFLYPDEWDKSLKKQDLLNNLLRPALTSLSSLLESDTSSSSSSSLSISDPDYVENTPTVRACFEYVSYLRKLKKLTLTDLRYWFNSDEMVDVDRNFSYFWARYCRTYAPSHNLNRKDPLRTTMVSLTVDNLHRINFSQHFGEIISTMASAKIKWQRELGDSQFQEKLKNTLERFAPQMNMETLSFIMRALGFMGLDWTKDLSNKTGEALINVILKFKDKFSTKQSHFILRGLVLMGFPSVKDNQNIRFSGLRTHQFMEWYATKPTLWEFVLIDLYIAQRALHYPFDDEVQTLLKEVKPSLPKHSKFHTSVGNQLQIFQITKQPTLKFETYYYEDTAKLYIDFVFLLPNGDKYALVLLKHNTVVFQDQPGIVAENRILQEQINILKEKHWHVLVLSGYDWEGTPDFNPQNVLSQLLQPLLETKTATESKTTSGNLGNAQRFCENLFRTTIQLGTKWSTTPDKPGLGKAGQAGLINQLKEHLPQFNGENIGQCLDAMIELEIEWDEVSYADKIVLGKHFTQAIITNKLNFTDKQTRVILRALADLKPYWLNFIYVFQPALDALYNAIERNSSLFTTPDIQELDESLRVLDFRKPEDICPVLFAKLPPRSPSPSHSQNQLTIWNSSASRKSPERELEEGFEPSLPDEYQYSF